MSLKFDTDVCDPRKFNVISPLEAKNPRIFIADIHSCKMFFDKK